MPSKPEADDGKMRLGIGTCKRQVRLTLGMNLEERFALAHDLPHRPHQAYPCRHMGWCTGALGDTGHLPAVDLPDPPVHRGLDDAAIGGFGRQVTAERPISSGATSVSSQKLRMPVTS